MNRSCEQFVLFADWFQWTGRTKTKNKQTNKQKRTSAHGPLRNYFNWREHFSQVLPKPPRNASTFDWIHQLPCEIWSVSEKTDTKIAQTRTATSAVLLKFYFTKSTQFTGRPGASTRTRSTHDRNSLWRHLRYRRLWRHGGNQRYCGCNLLRRRRCHNVTKLRSWSGLE